MTEKPKKKPRDSLQFDRALERFVYWIFISLVFLLPIIIFPWEDDVFSLPKATLLRILFLVAAVSWVTLSLLQERLRFKRSPFDLPLLVFVALLSISTVFSFNRFTSLFADAYIRHENFFTWLIYVGILGIIVQGLRNKENVRRILEVMVVASGPVSLYGIAQTLGLDFLNLETQGLLRIQAKSTFGNPAYLGGYLCLIFPITLALAISETKLPKRVLWILLAFLATLSLVFTFTRGAWLGFLMGVLVFFLLTAGKALKNVSSAKRLRYLLVVFAILVVVAISVSELVPATSGLVLRRLQALVTAERAGSGRLYIWKNTLGLISQRPWLGWGLNTFKDVLPYDKPEFEFAKLIDRPHNQVLFLAVSGGALLLLAYFWFMVAYFLYARNVLNRTQDQASYVLLAGLIAGVTGYLVHEQFFFSLVGVTPLFWTVVGLTVVIGQGAREREWKSGFLVPSFWRWSGIVLTVSLTLILGMISLRLAAANYFHSRGLLLENREEFAESARYNQTAVNLNPWENRYKFSLGQELESYSMVTRDPGWAKQAIPVYFAGLKQNPRDYDLQFALGKTYYTISFLEKSRDYHRAKEFLNRASELRPLVPEPYLWLGLAFLQEGDSSRGVAYLERSRQLGSTEFGDLPVLFALAQGYHSMGKDDKAETFLRKALKLDPMYEPARDLLDKLEKKGN